MFACPTTGSHVISCIIKNVDSFPDPGLELKHLKTHFPNLADVLLLSPEHGEQAPGILTCGEARRSRDHKWTPHLICQLTVTLIGL